MSNKIIGLELNMHFLINDNILSEIKYIVSNKREKKIYLAYLFGINKSIKCSFIKKYYADLFKDWY